MAAALCPSSSSSSMASCRRSCGARPLQQQLRHLLRRLQQLQDQLWSTRRCLWSGGDCEAHVSSKAAGWRAALGWGALGTRLLDGPTVRTSLPCTRLRLGGLRRAWRYGTCGLWPQTHADQPAEPDACGQAQQPAHLRPLRRHPRTGIAQAAGVEAAGTRTWRRDLSVACNIWRLVTADWDWRVDHSLLATGATLRHPGSCITPACWQTD